MEPKNLLKESVVAYAKELRLPSVWKSYQELIEQAQKEVWSYEVFLLQLLKREAESRIDNRRKSQMRRAGFPQYKYLQEISRNDLPPEMDKKLPELETLDFIKKGQNIVLAGNPGTGKTHIAIALGIKACQEGYNVLYTSVPHLLTQIRECRSQRVLRQLELRFEKFDLVVCDEFGYISCDKEGAELLFNHLSLRTGRKSTIITTNLSFDRWSEIFIDPVLTTAMVDRLTHKAFLINMNGKSYRMKETREWMNNNQKKEEMREIK